MKNLIIATALSISATSVSTLFQETRPVEIRTSEAQKVAVRPEDLPEAVKSALNNEGNTEYKVTNAYLVTRDNQSQYYEINLKKEDGSSTVYLDKYGKKVEP